MNNNTHLIQTPEELSKLYAAPHRSSQRKVHDYLTESMQQWLQHSPFFILSSNSTDGIDCSARGDAPGSAFQVIDQHHIVIPDRRGNNRIDTLKNILDDPRIGLVFMIPGKEELLRIKGTASISTDPRLLTRFQLDNVMPSTVMIVAISKAFVQNARAVRSSGLWQFPETQSSPKVPDANDLYS